LRAGVVAGFVLFIQHTTVWDDVTTTWTDEFGEEHTDTVSVPRDVALMAPGIGKGVLFAQGAMWRPATPPIVPDVLGAGLWHLCYNTTHGLYWWASQYGQYDGDAYLGWAASDGTGVVAVSVTRLGDGAAGGQVTQVGGAVNQPVSSGTTSGPGAPYDVPAGTGLQALIAGLPS
jgi:hypothetical protein